MTTEATILAKFGDEVADSTNYLVKIELDEESNKDSNGNVKTEFSPGDTVYFLVQHESRVRIKRVSSSLGDVQALGDVSQKRTERMIFTEDNEEKEFGYIGSSTSTKWFGNQITCEWPSDTKISSKSGSYPAIGDVTKTCKFKKYCLHTPSFDLGQDEEFPIVVVVYMEVVE